MREDLLTAIPTVPASPSICYHNADTFSKEFQELFLQKTGIQLTFDSKLEPQWRNGRLRLNNVRLVRRTDLLPVEYQVPNLTHMDVTIDTMEISLDALRYMSGFGLVRECYVKGVRGVIDRRHLDFTGVDPSTWLIPRDPTPNDFDWKRTVVENVHLTIMDYHDFRPYVVQIHQADLPRCRLHWLLYDIISAERIVGEYDGAMFSLTKPNFSTPSNRVDYPQSRLPFRLINDDQSNERISKLRMTGIQMDMLNTGAKGPLGWIERGTVDMDAYIVLPRPVRTNNDDDDHSDDPFDEHDERMLANLAGELDEIKEKLFQELVQPIRQKLMDDLRRKRNRNDGKDGRDDETADVAIDEVKAEDKTSAEGLSDEAAPGKVSVPPSDVPITAPSNTETPAKDMDRIRFYVDVRLHNIRASVNEKELQDSSIPSALVRPVVAYLNAQPTAPRGRKTAAPPISASFTLPFAQFNGAWTLYQCGLMDVLASSVTNALARMVVIRYVEYQRRGRKKQQEAMKHDSRWLPWIVPEESKEGGRETRKDDLSKGKQGERKENDGDNDDDDDDDEEEDLDVDFGPNVLEDGGGEARGLNLISRVAWYTLQQALHGPPSSNGHSEEDMIEVYNEIIWGL